MNEKSITKVISISTSALGPSLTKNMCPAEWLGPIHKELFDLLVQKNGFYAFESALLVRPLGVIKMYWI